jgi:hypothetical protein
MIMNREDDLSVYTLEEAAAVLKCELAWLEEQARQGKIPYMELGGSLRFTGSHLAAIIAMHEQLPLSMPGAAPLAPPRAWNADEAAALLRCKASWLREQARNNRIPYTKLSGSYRFTDDHLSEITRIFEVPAARPAQAPPAPAPARPPLRPRASPLPPLPGTAVPQLKARPLRKRGGSTPEAT